MYNNKYIINLINFEAIRNIPFTIKSLLTKVILNKNKNLSGFNKIFSAIIYWYFWISKIFVKYGWNGYSFETMLGTKIKSQIYNPFIGYGMIMHWLKNPYYFIKISVILTIVTITSGFFIITNDFLYSIISLLFLIASPSFIYSFIHAVKQENIFWFIFVAFIFAIYLHNFVLSAILLILLLTGNLSIFFITFVFCISALYFGLLSIKQSLVVVLPSFLIGLILFFDFFKNISFKNFMGDVNIKSSHKYGIIHRILYGYKNNIETQSYRMIFIFIYFLFAVIVYIISKDNFVLSLLFTFIFLQLFQECFFRFADNQTFARMAFCVLAVTICIAQNYYILLFALIPLYINDTFFSILDVPAFKNIHKNRYPYFKETTVFHKAYQKIVTDINKKLGTYQRLLFEINSEFNYTHGEIRFFQSVLHYSLTENNNTIVPPEGLVYLHKDYVDTIYKAVNYKTPISKIINIMKDTGSQYIMSYTSFFKDKLVKSNLFDLIYEFPLKNNIEYSIGVEKIVNATEIQFTFFRFKEKIKLIDNCEKYELVPNNIFIYGQPNAECLIKFTFHNQWKPKLIDTYLKKINHNGLNFMKAKLNENGVGHFQFI